MFKINANLAMLWGMAITITLSLLILQHLESFGLHPVHAALFQAIGCAVSIAVLDRGAVQSLTRHRDGILYFAIASLLGFTVPRLVVSSAVSHTGVGLATLAFTLPLVVTYGIALATRLESFDRQKFAFLAVALAGALLYVSTRLDGMADGGIWILVLMLAPVSLGIGNIYRTTARPPCLRPNTAALATSLCSLISYLAIASIAPVTTPTSFFTEVGHLAVLLVFMGAAAVGQLLLFQLQYAAGPVYIGQAGALVVLLGGLSGFLIYGEPYSLLTLVGSLLILLGVTTYSRVQTAPDSTVLQGTNTRS